MNLHYKKARVSIAALGVTALIAGAGALTSPAFADGVTLGLSASSATILGVEPTANPGLTYGLKLSGDTGTNPLRVENLTGPGPLKVLRTVKNASSAVVPSVNSTLSAVTPAAGATQIALAAGQGAITGVAVGDTVTFAVGTAESRTVTLVSTDTLTLNAPIAGDHTLSTAVTITKPSTASTTLTSVSATALVVASSAGVAVGDTVAFTDNPETSTVGAVNANGTGITLTGSGAANAHAAGTDVTFGKPAVSMVLTTNPVTCTCTTVVVNSTAGLEAGDSVTGVGATALPVASVTNGTTFEVTGSPTTHAAGLPVFSSKPWATAAVGASALVPNYQTGDRLYLGAALPGTYTLRFFKDENETNTYDNGDNTTPTFTLTVKDPTAAGVFDLSVPTSVDAGTTKAKTTVATSLTTSDIRGSSGTPAVGALGLNIASQLHHRYTVGTNLLGTLTAVGGPNDTVSSFFNGTNFYQWLSAGSGGATQLTWNSQSGTTNSIGTQLKFQAGTVFPSTAKPTDVTTSGVSTLTFVPATGQGANVTGSAPVKLRTGVSKITYTATTGGAVGVSQAGKTVTFSFGSFTGVALADLSVNGAAVPTTGASAGQVTATTNLSGVATIDVTSAMTASGNAYTVTAASGTASDVPISVQYTKPAASVVAITSSAAELSPAVTATSVPIKGQLTDQFGQVFLPSSSDNQQVAVSGDATGNASFTAGIFTYTYVPSGTPVAGTTKSLTFSYVNDSITATPTTATIHWASTSTATKVTLLTPLDGAKAVTLQRNLTPNPTQTSTVAPAFGNTTGAVTGTVYDATNAALAFKSVTLSGSDGVYFSSSNTPDATHQLVKTLDVVTNSSGMITGAYVYFTKAGTAKVTATSGTGTTAVSTDSTVTTGAQDLGEKYRVSVDDVTSTPGTTVIVTGKVLDIFGNPVPSATVTLSTGTTTIGALGLTGVTANSEGVFSTTFLSGANQSGVVDLTATLTGQVTNVTPNAAYATAGLTLTDGTYTDAGKITVTATKFTLSSTAKVIGSGSTTVSGMFLPTTAVDIYTKSSGANGYTLFDSVMTDSAGKYSASYPIKKTTSFLAKAAGLSSPTDTTTVYSAVTLTAKSYSHDRATLSANGSPNAKGTLTFYRSVAGPDKKLKTITSNSSGNGTVTVSLPKGNRVVYVTFTATGTSKGTSSKHTVKVK